MVGDAVFANMACRSQSKLLRPLLQRSSLRTAGSGREVSTYSALRSGHSPENDATALGETEDFASKILLEMRGRKGDEVRPFALVLEFLVADFQVFGNAGFLFKAFFGVKFFFLSENDRELEID